MARDGVEQRSRPTPRVCKEILRLAPASDEETQWTRRSGIDDDIVPAHPVVELTIGVSVTAHDARAEISKRTRFELARGCGDALPSCEQVAHDGLSQMASGAEYEGSCLTTHSSP